MNVDHQEIDKFSTLADTWWDTSGPCKPLHDINPLRLSFITDHVDLDQKHVVDIGCGGGILTEAMATVGGICAGRDLSKRAIEVAQMHAELSELSIDYAHQSAHDLAAEKPEHFDVVTCMELLEHVPDPAQLIQDCAALLKPGGMAFFSTINRNAKAFMYAILGAEYVLNILPKGTHHYDKFIKPSELCAWVRHAGLTPGNMAGMEYHLFQKTYSRSRNCDVNYLLACTKYER